MKQVVCDDETHHADGQGPGEVHRTCVKTTTRSWRHVSSAHDRPRVAKDIGFESFIADLSSRNCCRD